MPTVWKTIEKMYNWNISMNYYNIKKNVYLSVVLKSGFRLVQQMMKMPTGVTLVLNNEKDILKTIIHFKYIIALLSFEERLQKISPQLYNCWISDQKEKKIINPSKGYGFFTRIFNKKKLFPEFLDNKEKKIRKLWILFT